MATSKPKRKISNWWIVGGALILLVVGIVAARPLLAQNGLLPMRGQANTANAAPTTGEVTSITAITSVDTSGSIEAEQMASVFWETTGQIATVNVAPGATVKKGDVLMTLDPASAPQNVIQAQADLINAQNALDDLLHPTALALAKAEKAVVDAEAALTKAQDDLDDLVQNDISYYEEQVTKKEQALLAAQQDAEKTNLGQLAIALQNAQDDLDKKTDWLNDARSAQAACPNCTTVFVNAAGRKMSVADAEEAYTAALNAHQVADINYQQALTNSNTAVDNAQEALDTARANLADAQTGPETDDVKARQVAVTVAQATLADAQDKLDTLTRGADPDDIAAAEVRVQIAQATLDKIFLRAPFDGEVLVINYQPGDTVSQSKAALTLANRALLHVDASVDEADINTIAVGDPVTLTFDALADMALPATVAWINPVGQTTQGLVRYTVRLDAAQTDPRVLLGMTANVTIVTEVQQDALAVPLDAVQLDDAGEYVNRVNALGALERVNVVSGAVQGEVVIITGALRPGDQVELVQPKPTNNGGMFGPG